MTPPERHAAVLEALDQQIGDPFLPDPFRRVWEGCRRIIQRHPPEVGIDDIPYCYRCAGQWPCPEWLDAACGVEER